MNETSPCPPEIRDAKRPTLPARPEFSHKGTFGTVAVIAGSKNMAGAAFLAAKAAYTCGAGLVKIFTPGENRVILQTLLPEAVLFTYDHETPLSKIVKEVSACTSAVIGPGLGQSERSGKIVCALLSECTLPAVLDADGLNLAAGSDLIANYRGKLVLTPHPGEAARLLHTTAEEAVADPLSALARLTALGASAAILKGAHTLIGDGTRIRVNRRPNSGMAVGGCGDVLAGILGELLCEFDDPLDAAEQAVVLHSLAGELAAKKHGKRPMTASHVLEGLEKLLKDL